MGNLRFSSRRDRKCHSRFSSLKLTLFIRFHLIYYLMNESKSLMKNSFKVEEFH